MPISITQEQVSDSATGYLFSFSGAVLTAGDAFPLATIRRGGLTIAVNPMLRLAPPTWRPIPQVTEANFHLLFPDVPYPNMPLRLAVVPGPVAADGSVGLTIHGGDVGVDPMTLPKDTLLAVASGIGHGESAPLLSEEILPDLFAWIRVMTHQWWVGRPSEPLTGNLHLLIPIAAGGKTDGYPFPQGQQATGSAKLKPLTPDVWLECASKVDLGKKPKTSERLFQETCYLYFAKQYESSVLTACTLFELEVDRILTMRSVRRSAMKCGDTDLPKHVSTGFKNVLGRDMSTEQPKEFAFLKSLWIARGNVAHGRPLVWIHMGKKTKISEMKQEDFIRTLDSAVGWFEAFA